MDDIGNINGKPAVFNDILAYVHSKVKLCTPFTLINVISSFYATEDLQEARDILSALLNPQGDLPRQPNITNLAYSIVTRFTDKYDELNYSFLALNLNHIPYLDLIDEEAIRIFLERHKVQRQLQEVLAEQVHVKEQLALINEKLLRMNDVGMAKQKQTEPKANQAQGNKAQSSRSPSESSPSPQTYQNKTKSNQSSSLHSLSPSTGPSDEGDTAQSPRTLADIVKRHVPSGHSIDSDGFIYKDKRQTKQQQHHRAIVTGTKSPVKLRPAVNDVRIFATKLSPEETENDIRTYVEEMIGDQCTVEKIRSRTTRHSSFIVTVARRYEAKLLDPSSWEEGVQVRHFYGRLGGSAKHINK